MAVNEKDATEAQRGQMEAFLAFLRRDPPTWLLYEQAGRKRIFSGGCLICESPRTARAAAFAPDPGAVPELEGRVAFYALCGRHFPPDAAKVEARLVLLSVRSRGGGRTAFGAPRGPGQRM